MTTTIEPRCKIKSPKNETILFEANFERSKVCVPKRLSWNEITQNQTWNLENICQPKPIKLNNQVSSIIEHTDGNIEINFGNIESSRYSTYIPETSTSDNEAYIRRSQSTKFVGVDFDRSIPKPLYEFDNKSDDTFNPTKSEMNYYKEENI